MSYEQYPVAVRNYSSEYGSPYSCTQVLKNVCGEPCDILQYGDNQYAAVFRNYGKWGQLLPSYLNWPSLRAPCHFVATDFMECAFSSSVYATSIQIRVNFFPGSTRRILGTKNVPHNSQSTKVQWLILWEQSSEQPYTAKDYEYHLKSYEFTKTAIPIDVIRIEFDFSDNEYFYEIEAIKLIGEKSDSDSCTTMLYKTDNRLKDMLNCGNIWLDEYDLHNEKRGISSLPSEILIKIFGYLDIDDLCRTSRINKLFNFLSKDLSLYVSINLKPYYQYLVNDSLLNLSKRCLALHKLDISWLGSNNQITTPTLCSFLKTVPNITELRMSSCPMLASSVLETLAIYCPKLELLDIAYCNNSLQLCVSWLTNLKNLKYLNITHTIISTSELLLLLSKLKNLHWLMLGAPAIIADQDSIIDLITDKPPGLLRGINLWYWDKISFSSMRQFLRSQGQFLFELDLGWCLNVGCHDVLPIVANSCPNIMALFLTAHYETTDSGLHSFAKSCQKIRQLDILGSRHITFDSLETLLLLCKDLVLLDVSYCSKVSVEDVAILQSLSLKVSIKHVETYISKSSSSSEHF